MIEEPEPSIAEGKGIGEVENVELTEPLDENMIEMGEAIYQMKCAACHKLTDQRVVGPGWAGITNKRKPEWIMNKVMPNVKKFYALEENTHPYAAKGEGKAKVEREGDEIHVYMTAIRSHLAPDNIEGIKVGDEVYFHLTNLEQDWDVPHGFAILGNTNAELLVMPGQTRTLKWEPQRVGVFPFYCTDFCSALHQEMSGYARVSPKGSDVALKWGLNENLSEKDMLSQVEGEEGGSM